MAGGGWGRQEASRHVQRGPVMEADSAHNTWRRSCLDSFPDARMKRAALAQLYSSAKKVVPEQFLKNTCNHFSYPNKVAYFDILE